MPLQEAVAPAGGLYRVGRRPEPLALPPWAVVGHGRFDDSLSKTSEEPQYGRFRTLYAGERRVACFVECLEALRPAPEYLVRMASLDPETQEADALANVGTVTAAWRRRRAVQHFGLAPGQRWLDLRSPETVQVLRAELAALLVQRALPDLDLSSVRGPYRGLSQAIARWAYERGYHGLVYRSRFSDELDLWALFEHRAEIAASGRLGVIRADDPDLVAAARLLGLAIV